jgi:1,6-anhydro-N-acetylmuramate kinase
MVVRTVAGEHQQLLDAAPPRRRAALDLGGLVQVRLVRREGAVLAVRSGTSARATA